MKERGEGRKEEKAGGRKLGGRRDKEGRKKEKKGGRNNKERKKETDRETWLDYPRKHTEVGIWSRTESATCSVRNRNSGIRSELKVSKFQFLQLQNENTNFQAL